MHSCHEIPTSICIAVLQALYCQQVADVALGKAECCICHLLSCHKTPIKSCILSYKQNDGVLSVLLYFTLFVESVEPENQTVFDFDTRN